MIIYHFPDKYNSVPQANSFVKVSFQAKRVKVHGCFVAEGVNLVFVTCTSSAATPLHFCLPSIIMQLQFLWR